MGPGGEFVLRLRVDGEALTGPGQVVVAVYDRVATRSEFALNLDDRILGSPIPGGVRVTNLTDATVDANGDIRVAIPLRHPDGEADPSRLDLGRSDGVHPVRVALREIGGGTVASFTTHLVYLPAARPGTRLGVALVLPLDAPPALAPDGSVSIGAAPPTAVAALDGARTLPFTLVPTPETVVALDALGERGQAALTTLRRVAADHPVVAGTFVPVDVPALAGAGLGGELARQLATGREAIEGSLDQVPDTHTWIGWEPLDPGAVQALAASGIDRIVLPEAALEHAGLNISLTRPFTLEAGGMELPAAMADSGLTATFTAADTPVLAAHHLLADLAVLYLDEPRADRRGVVAAPPRDWRATKAFLDVLVAGLVQNPVIEPVTLDRLFADVLPAVTSRGAPLVRTLAPLGRPEPGELALVASDLSATRSRLASLAAVLDGRSPLAASLDQRLLVAQGHRLPVAGVDSGLPTGRAYVDAVAAAIDTHLADIRMPQTRSITLTAREADIPMTFQNRTGHPALVMVEMESDKLDFPGGVSRQVLLTRLNTTERFQVVSRTSGAFPLNIVLKSPDGQLVIGEIRVTVRSTAASGLSLVISVGAAGFLAVWWGRHVVRGRRARRLVAP